MPSCGGPAPGRGALCESEQISDRQCPNVSDRLKCWISRVFIQLNEMEDPSTRNERIVSVRTLAKCRGMGT
jgi:hypothetical protein